MSSELQKSVKNLIIVKEDRKRIIDFAKARYDEKFPTVRFDQGWHQGWHHYDSYQIINETTLRVKYKHGFGDYEHNESFDVDLIPYYRDEKLENIK
jgi:predicted Ser/Thr protein kinase